MWTRGLRTRSSLSWILLDIAGCASFGGWVPYGLTCSPRAGKVGADNSSAGGRRLRENARGPAPSPGRGLRRADADAVEQRLPGAVVRDQVREQVRQRHP